MYTALEERTLKPQPMEGVVLRYGFFYGPNTWYYPDGSAADQARAQQLPIVGEGLAVWSFVHIEDAAIATAAALTAEPGIYNIVDNDPTAVHLCVPKFAAWVGAPPPARAVAGEDAVYYNTKLRGASNEKVRKRLNFKPRRLQWL